MEGLRQEVAELQGQVRFLSNYVAGQMVKAILKQAGKIKKDPTDIKLIDIVEAIGFADLLTGISEEVEAAIVVIGTWYSENVVEEPILAE